MPRYQPAEPVLRSATTHSTVAFAGTVGYDACVWNAARYASSGGRSNWAGASFALAADSALGSWNVGSSKAGIWIAGSSIVGSSIFGSSRVGSSTVGTSIVWRTERLQLISATI